MIIQLKKFGTLLMSRPTGKEAYLAFQPTLREVKKDDKIVIDFEGVQVLGPSWADEFITPLKKNFPGRVECVHTENPSVKATLEILNEAK